MSNVRHESLQITYISKKIKVSLDSTQNTSQNVARMWDEFEL
jgi:hypothetical protein